MDNRDALKSMLNNLINDNGTGATADFHTYVTMKMRDVMATGGSTGTPAPATDETDTSAD